MSINTNSKKNLKQFLSILFSIVITAVLWFLLALTSVLLGKLLTGKSTADLGPLTWLILGGGGYFSARFAWKISKKISDRLLGA